MKQILSMEQVNSKLPSGLSCYKVDYNRLTSKPYYYFMLREKALLVAFGKNVFCHELNGENERKYKGMHLTLDDREYVPLIDKEQAEKLLITCGLKEPKKIKPISDYDLLKEICGKSIADIYKMMLSLTGLRGDLEMKENRYNKFLALVITHDKGSFSIPIEQMAIDGEYTDEAQNIFFNALNMETTSKLKTA